MNQNKTWNTTWSNYPSEMEMINQEGHRSRQRFQSFRFLRGTSISRSHFERFPTLCREYLVTVPTNGVDRSNPPPVPKSTNSTTLRCEFPNPWRKKRGREGWSSKSRAVDPTNGTALPGKFRIWEINGNRSIISFAYRGTLARQAWGIGSFFAFGQVYTARKRFSAWQRKISVFFYFSFFFQ